MAQPKHPLLSFDGSQIPQSLKDQPRWAPWKAVWSEKRQKYDKIPYRADAPAYGISTANPDRWTTYASAMACLDANPAAFNGLGFVLTGIKNTIGIDIDNCIDASGVVAPWALEIVGTANSYTEISPSGRGLRIFLTGAQENDWMNHEQGIEVYGGNDARFLTVSGAHVAGTPADILPADKSMLSDLESRYAKARTKATIIDLQMPELLDELALPDLATLELPYKVRDFLTDGTIAGDRSHLLHQTGIALYAAGLDDSQVFSVLATNDFTMEVALDHRNQDRDRAAMYLWREQCLKTKPKAQSRVANLDDFEDVSDKSDAVNPASGKAPSTKEQRFKFVVASEYRKRDPITWLIKRVLPKADVGAIFGESGAGKSFFALDMAMAMARGVEWNGHRVKQTKVAYVVAEGAAGFAGRLDAYCEHHGVDLADIPLVVLGAAPNFLEKQDIKDVLAGLDAHPGVGIVFIDTFAQVTPGANENSGEDMGRALAHTKMLASRQDAMVVLVAHAGKDTTRGLRGWSGIKAALDVEIMVERDSTDKRKAVVTKMKDGEGENTEFIFELDKVVLGQDSDGDDVTSCVLKMQGTQDRTVARAKLKGVHEAEAVRIITNTSDLGALTFNQLSAQLVASMPKPEGRDQRKTIANQAIRSAQAKGYITAGDGETELNGV